MIKVYRWLMVTIGVYYCTHADIIVQLKMYSDQRCWGLESELTL